MADGAVSYTITLADGTTIPFVGSGDAFSSYIETKDLFTESRDSLKFVQRLRNLINDADDTVLQVVFKYRNDLMEDFGTTVPSLVTSGKVVNIRVPGAKLVRVRFEDSSVRRTRRWGIAQFELLGQLGGNRAT